MLARDAYTPLVQAEAWLPLTAMNDDVTNRGWRGFTAIGRLAPGSTLEAARQELQVVRAALAASYPDTNRDFGLELQGLRERTAGGVQATLWAFLGAVCCVLLIGCANVAGLMLVRATARRRELAVRAALGASPARLVRETLAESLVLAAAGAAIGLLLSSWGLRAFVALAPASVPRLGEVGLDARALAFGSVVALGTVLLFGLAPAVSATRVDLVRALQGVRTTDGGGARFRRGLVVAQVALALVLLTGAGVLARSLAGVLRWDPGFDTRGVASLWVLAPTEEYRTGLEAVAALERASEVVRELPGVAAAGLASAGPLIGGVETAAVAAFGRSESDGVAARWYDVSPGYFGTLGVSVVRGRDFATTDGPAAPAVAVVNQALARRLWPGLDPLGRELTIEGERRAVVGVVRDVPPVTPGAATPAEVFRPKRQYPRWGTFLMLRASGDPGALERSVRQRLSALDPGLELGRFRTLDQALERQVVSPRFALALAGSFACVALALAAVGLYGVLAFSVASRTREIGIRLALGATPRALALTTLREGLRLVAGGLALGLVAATAAEPLVRRLVPDLPHGDAGTRAAAALVFTLVALLACFLPALRASRLDPVVALRVE